MVFLQLFQCFLRMALFTEKNFDIFLFVEVLEYFCIPKNLKSTLYDSKLTFEIFLPQILNAGRCINHIDRQTSLLFLYCPWDLQKEYVWAKRLKKADTFRIFFSEHPLLLMGIKVMMRYLLLIFNYCSWNDNVNCLILPKKANNAHLNIIKINWRITIQGKSMIEKRTKYKNTTFFVWYSIQKNNSIIYWKIKHPPLFL